MRIQSMTGFSRKQGSFNDISWTWEMRSVNGKGLDLRMRIPPGFDDLEQPTRRQLANQFARGNIQVNLDDYAIPVYSSRYLRNVQVNLSIYAPFAFTFTIYAIFRTFR